MSAPYEFQLVVPPNTPESSPAIFRLDVADARIKHVSIFFPSGCYYAIGIRIRDRGAQYAPRDSGWIRDDDRAVQWDDDHELAGPPCSITVEGYSDADDYAHTIEIRIVSGS